MSDISTGDIVSAGKTTIGDGNLDIDLAIILGGVNEFEKHANIGKNRDKLDNLIEKINNNDGKSIKITLINPSKTFDKIINIIDNFIDEIISYYKDKRLSNVLLLGESFTFIY